MLAASNGGSLSGNVDADMFESFCSICIVIFLHGTIDADPRCIRAVIHANYSKTSWCVENADALELACRLCAPGQMAYILAVLNLGTDTKTCCLVRATHLQPGKISTSVGVLPEEPVQVVEDALAPPLLFLLITLSLGLNLSCLHSGESVSPEICT